MSPGREELHPPSGLHDTKQTRTPLAPGARTNYHFLLLHWTPKQSKNCSLRTVLYISCRWGTFFDTEGPTFLTKLEGASGEVPQAFLATALDMSIRNGEGRPRAAVNIRNT